MKILIISFLLIFFSLLNVDVVRAESNYVLPYPSYMPGNFFYKPRLILSKISQYVYFGDFGKFDYNLKEADHYLVESKTLFEYKQYLLAANALRKSDEYFTKISPTLDNARKNGKDISEREGILKEASRKHMETLGHMRNQLPDQVVWSPEDSSSTNLNLMELIDNAINIRSSSL